MITEKLIIGAVAGDMVGSLHKGKKPGPESFDLLNDRPDFTSDTVLNVAVMESLLRERDYARSLKVYGRKYKDRDYGKAFDRWLQQDDPKPYHSWNNGAALRVSPIGFACRTLKEVSDEAYNCASVSHNHPDGIKGAVAIAVSVFLARNGRTKDEIRDYIESTFSYDLHRQIDHIRPDYYYDRSSEASVPESIIAFLDSTDYENAIRLAISLGGDSGRLACLTGGIAQAFYKEVPVKITNYVIEQLPHQMLETLNEFSKTYPLSLFH